MEDEQAFRQLFDRHFAELYRFTYRYVQSVETAKDILHDAFLVLWQRRDRVDLTDPGARAYLFTVARYEALDYLRRQRVATRWAKSRYSALVEMDDGALAPDPEQEFVSNETLATIQRAVDALPRRQREVLMMRWQRGASYAVIAQTLGISPKTVAVHIGRAIQHLREVLTEIRQEH